jgi:hypothetical protein
LAKIWHPECSVFISSFIFKLLNTNRNLFHLKPQSVPRRKHFSSRL